MVLEECSYCCSPNVEKYFKTRFGYQCLCLKCFNESFGFVPRNNNAWRLRYPEATRITYEEYVIGTVTNE